MLNLTACTIYRSTEFPLAPNAKLTAVGACLVASNPVGTVELSTGAPDEVFVGITACQQLDLTSLPKVENFEVPKNRVICLSKKPESGSVLVQGDESATVDGCKVTISSEDLVGKIVTITYRYCPTVLEAKFIQGDIQPGGASASNMHSVTTILAGEVFTSEFDTTKDWNNTKGKTICVGPNGLISYQDATGTATAIPNARVTSVPSSGKAELGLYFSA